MKSTVADSVSPNKCSATEVPQPGKSLRASTPREPLRALRPLARRDRDIVLRAFDELHPARVARVLRARHASLDVVRALVLLLAQHADDTFSDCYPPQWQLLERLAIESNLRRAERSLRNALRAAEDLELVETLEGPDAHRVYLPRAPNLNHNRNAYRILPLVKARRSVRRAPRVDRRTPSQRSRARSIARAHRAQYAEVAARAARLGLPPPAIADGRMLFGMPETPARRPTGTAVAAATAPPPPPADPSGRHLPATGTGVTPEGNSPNAGRGNPFAGRLSAALEKAGRGGGTPRGVPPRPGEPVR